MKNNIIDIEDHTAPVVISDSVRKIDELLNQINQTMVGDQGLVCEGALLYIATALVHSTGNVQKNTEQVKALLDKYIIAVGAEHTGCVEALRESGEQGDHLPQ